LNASTIAITRYLPSVAGLLMESEMNGLNLVKTSIRPPVASLLGGARLIDKTMFIDKQLHQRHRVLLGGVLANTFLRAKGYETGQSTVELEAVRLARSLLNEYPENIVLPIDLVTADSLSPTARTKIVPANRIPSTAFVVDVGPDTIERFRLIFEKAGSVMWNGPMGITEIEPFAAGTYALAKKIAALEGVFKVACGGDTIAALDAVDLTTKFNYISTGGASFLDAIDDELLPAIRMLEDKNELAGTGFQQERRGSIHS
jgi:phosphoglycerate kinase